MQVVMRADSSSQMGSGHLMRCLTLAEELREEKNANILFICRDLPGNLSNIVEGKGYQLTLLPYHESLQASLEDLSEYKQWLGATICNDRDQTINVIKDLSKVDLLVVDNYALDETWENPMRQYAKKILVIDDLADRRHDCDVLLDHNYYTNLECRYDALVPIDCKRLLGPKHALLNPALDEVRRYRLEHKLETTSKIERIVVFMGGADVGNFTLRVVQQLLNINLAVVIDVVVGSSSANKNEIKQLCHSHDNFIYHEQPENYYHLLALADLAIGAGGVSQLERTYIQLPSIVLSIAANQINIIKDMFVKKYLIFIKDISMLGVAFNNIDKIKPMGIKRLSRKDLTLLCSQKKIEVT